MQCPSHTNRERFPHSDELRRLALLANNGTEREKEELSIYQYSVEEGISSGVPRDPEPHQVTTQLPAERERTLRRLQT